MGLGAVGGTGTTTAIESAVEFFLANQLANGGFPFFVTAGFVGAEFTNVDSEVVRAIDVLYSTAVGESVQVTPAQLATVTFTTVTAPGSTTVVARAIETAPRVPNGYALLNGLTYEVDTTATVSGQIQMCVLAYWPLADASFDQLRILQVDRRGNSQPRFADRTILKGAFAPDAAASRLCAELPSLDPIAIAVRERGR
jgi:hypothetical protein